MKIHFFTRKYQPFNKLQYSVEVRMLLIAFAVGLVAIIAIYPFSKLWSTISGLGCLTIAFMSGRPVAIIAMLLQIRRWDQGRKDRALLEAVQDKNIVNVRVLIWAGANVNRQHRQENADPWDDWRNWTYYYVNPLDCAGSGKIRDLLLKHGAVSCPNKEVYHY